MCPSCQQGMYRYSRPVFGSLLLDIEITSLFLKFLDMTVFFLYSHFFLFRLKAASFAKSRNNFNDVLGISLLPS
jgi:hypothetical protein